MSTGRVLFVGCVPGAADLLTVRAVRALATADVVVWNASLLDRQSLAGHVRADAEIVEWPPATQRDVESTFDRARAEGLLVGAGSLAADRAHEAVAVYGSTSDPHRLQAALRARGLGPSTPCTVAIEVSRRDEMLVSCPLEDLGATVEDVGMGLLTIVFAGIS